jgi:hypothetical protein
MRPWTDGCEGWVFFNYLMQHTKFNLQVLREATSGIIILHTVSYLILTEACCDLIIYLFIFSCLNVVGLTTCTYIPMKYSLHKQIILFYLHSILFTFMGPFQVSILYTYNPFHSYIYFPISIPSIWVPSTVHSTLTVSLQVLCFSHSWGKGRHFFLLYPCSIVFTFMLNLLNT